MENKILDELTLDATIENIERVTAFVDELLEAAVCPQKAQAQINIAIDELFGNIAHYAYNPKTGPATVRVEASKDEVAITFIDGGAPYNPLSAKEPDIALPAEERGIGGLGIYMVKSIMDGITYKHEDGKNILTIRKEFS